MRAAVVALTCLAGCGRFSFDTHDADAAGATCITQISAGQNLTCATDRDGSAWCWGANRYGQILPNGPTIVEAPTRIDLPGPVAEVHAARLASCALLVDGRVFCWGDNSGGELGNAALPSPSGPVEVDLGGELAAAFDLGGQHACVIRASDRSIVCWGDNKSFAVGTAQAGPQPPTVVPGTAGTKQLVLGHRYVCGIDAQDRPFCWGRGSAGQLGDGGTTDHANPTFVTSIPTATTLGAGNRQTCTVSPGGALHCFGERYNGGSQFDRWGNTTIVSDAESVTVGEYRGCAVRTDKTVACWGYVNQDGDTLLTNTPSPMQLTNVTAIDGAWYHYCAIANGQAVCWGSNERAQLGRGTRSFVASPAAPVPLPATPSSMAIGRGAHACAVVGGRLYCWGANFGAEVGDGTTRAAYTPIEIVTGLPTVEGITDRCAWGAGAGVCWGEINGQLTGPVAAPVSNVSRIAAGSGFACAITGTTVQCWGTGEYGQLGNGNTIDSATGVTATGVTNATSLCAGTSSACAVANGGVVYCWGENSSGEVGDNSTTVRSTPVALSLTAAEVSCGSAFACARESSGNVWCWGSNVFGELGQGNAIDSHVPVQVPLGIAATHITTGNNGACATLVNGETRCWGRGSDGENATGRFEDEYSPAVAPALAGATQIARGGGDGCAVVGGELVCWGSRIVLGIGDDSETRPQPIVGICP